MTCLGAPTRLFCDGAVGSQRHQSPVTSQPRRRPPPGAWQALGEMATKGTAVAQLRPGSSGGEASTVEQWVQAIRLLHVSCSVDVLRVQIRVLLALANPTVRVRAGQSARGVR